MRGGSRRPLWRIWEVLQEGGVDANGQFVTGHWSESSKSVHIHDKLCLLLRFWTLNFHASRPSGLLEEFVTQIVA